MSTNPYEYDDDVDADLFEVEEEAEPDPSLASPADHKHAIDGTMCPTCGVEHDVSDMFDPEDLPPEVRETILDFLDELPPEVVAHTLTVGPKAVKQASLSAAFLEFADHFDKLNTFGPILRAIVEHLDERTDGLITRRWRVYELERRIIAAHIALKSANTALDDAITNDAKPEMKTLVTTFVDIMTDRLAELVSDYRDECRNLEDYEPVDSVIEYGLYRSDEFENGIRKLMLEELHRILE